jgi:hypothetical protein
MMSLGLAGACGGSTSEGSPLGGDGGGVDGQSVDSSSSSDGAACLMNDPIEGSACTPGQTVCSHGNICCIGYVFYCDPARNVWEKQGVGCACMVGDMDAGGGDAPSDAPPDVIVPHDAGPFACGPSVTCSANQYCTDQPPGIPGPDGSVIPDFFSCTDFPAACGATPTCACITPMLPPNCTQQPAAGCSQDAEGNITVHCLGV